MPRSMASCISLMDSTSDSFGLPMCEPPSPMAETVSPVVPSGR